MKAHLQRLREMVGQTVFVIVDLSDVVAVTIADVTTMPKKPTRPYAIVDSKGNEHRIFSKRRDFGLFPTQYDAAILALARVESDVAIERRNIALAEGRRDRLLSFKNKLTTLLNL